MRPLCLLAALLAAGCGELSNAPLRTGAVEGVVAEADARVGLVTVLGRPELRAAIAQDGRFALTRLPAGQAELFIVANPTMAARVPVTVFGAQTTHLSVQPQPGAFVRYRLETRSMHSGDRVLLSLQGTPFVGLPFEVGGERRIGPLPPGCYDAFIRADAFGERTVETCVAAGEERLLEVDFTASPARCFETGCGEGLRCAADGRCVECLDDTQCRPGLSCVQGVCEGELRACATCTGDAQCGAGSCEGSSVSSVRYCAVSCTTDCPQSGFSCQQGLCVPNPAQFAGCESYSRVGTPCQDDAQCRAYGMYGGSCEAGVCTVDCDNDQQCPEGTRCRWSGSEGHCALP